MSQNGRAEACAGKPTTSPDTPGVSVHHIKHVFLEQKVCNGTEHQLSESSKICEIEPLRHGSSSVIRRSSAQAICPFDGRIGVAYVHTLRGVDHVGPATHMLSYSWSYAIVDIVDTLWDFCSQNELDPKRTYIWMDCLCINQHRVVAQKEAGGTGLLDFKKEFPSQLRNIGNMLAMMAPWKAPMYLTRIWCIFELWSAHNQGCRVSIVMPPREKESLKEDLFGEGSGFQTFKKALAQTKVQNAKASFEKDQAAILKMIQRKPGYKVFNQHVNSLVRKWAQDIISEHIATVEAACHSKTHARDDDERLESARMYTRIGIQLVKHRAYDRALCLFHKVLLIRESILGKEHADTAATHNDIGWALEGKGQFDQALEHYNTSQVVREKVLGEGHLALAWTYHNIGTLLSRRGEGQQGLVLHQKALSIRLAHLGRDHEDTFVSYNQIGLILQAQGDSEAALESFETALSIQETLHGKDYPDRAVLYANMASVLLDQRNTELALEKLEAAVSIWEPVYGKQHYYSKKLRKKIRSAQKAKHLK